MVKQTAISSEQKQVCATMFVKILAMHINLPEGIFNFFLTKVKLLFKWVIMLSVLVLDLKYKISLYTPCTESLLFKGHGAKALAQEHNKPD